jgi:glycosyltransferase involved in cell wall biosynthesis
MVAVSVIIPTRNHVEQLRLCLAALKQVRSELEWEALIVDNGSTDGTPNIELPIPNARIVHEPRPGLPFARNAGIASSAGEIVAFTDDDCYVTENFIDNLWEAFRDPSIGAIGGRILLYDRSDIGLTINESTQPKLFPPHSFIAAGEIQGANMAFRQTALNTIGPFDTAFSKCAADDCERIAAISWSGMSCAYDPNPTVYHHHRRKTQAQSRDLWRYYDTGRGAYYAKYILNRRSRSAYLYGWLKESVIRFHKWRGMRARLSAIRATGREVFGFSQYIFR